MDRIRSEPESERFDWGRLDRTRSVKTNVMPRCGLRPREVVRKSRNERDRESTCQDRPRGADSKEFLAALCGQKIKVEENPTDSEDEDQESFKSKSSKSSKPKRKLRE